MQWFWCTRRKIIIIIIFFIFKNKNKNKTRTRCLFDIVVTFTKKNPRLFSSWQKLSNWVMQESSTHDDQTPSTTSCNHSLMKPQVEENRFFECMRVTLSRILHPPAALLCLHYLSHLGLYDNQPLYYIPHHSCSSWCIYLDVLFTNIWKTHNLWVISWQRCDAVSFCKRSKVGKSNAIVTRKTHSMVSEHHSSLQSNFCD